MAAVRMLVRAELRRRWAATVVLALLVGVVGGTVVAAVAGARRTNTSFDRFELESNAAHVTINAIGLDPAALDEVEQLPEVEAFGRLAIFFLAPPNIGPSDAELAEVASYFASVDGELFDTIDRPRIISGREANPAAVDEVVVSEDTAETLDLEPGDALELDALNSRGELLRNFDVSLTVVGIGRLPSDLGGGPAGESRYAILTPAFYDSYHDRIGNFESIARARLEGGNAAVPAFTDAVEELYGGSQEQFFEPVQAESVGVDDSIDVLVVGLLLFAAAAGVAGATAVGFALGRQTFAAADDAPVLRALGLGPRERVAALVFPVVPVAVGGAVLAAVVAAAASPLFPIGIARRAEPDPGVAVDGAVLAVGSVAVVAVVLAIGALAAWRALRLIPESEEARGTWVATITGAMARAGFGPAVVTGVRMALLPGRGKTAVPVRAAVVGTAAGIAGIVAVVVFSASSDRLLDTPARYGWTWDVTIDGPPEGPDARLKERKVAARLHGDPNVTAMTVASFADMEIAGQPVSAAGFASAKGTIEPELLDGRPARSPKEAVLGTDTLDRIGVEIGDEFEISGPTRAETFMIVGRAVMPREPVADGIVLTQGGYKRLGGTEFPEEERVLLLSWAPGVDETAEGARVQQVESDALETELQLVTGPAPPTEVEKLDQVKALPRVLAGFLAVLAALSVAHALVTSIRRRRRDFAVLETLGFVRRQISAAVAWQASTTTLIGLVVGIPAGLIIGRAAWALVADGIGVATDPAVPVALLLLLVLAALLLANAVAAFPARAATRILPAVALRSE